ncbi:Hypothetical predicted protein, partial [Marmota monax]
ASLGSTPCGNAPPPPHGSSSPVPPPPLGHAYPRQRPHYLLTWSRPCGSAPPLEAKT